MMAIPVVIMAVMSVAPVIMVPVIVVIVTVAVMVMIVRMVVGGHPNSNSPRAGSAGYDNPDPRARVAVAARLRAPGIHDKRQG